MRFGHFLAFAVLVVAAFIAAVPAYAQNNKPIRSGNWYEDRASIGFLGSAYTLTFAQAPTDKFLNITHVACLITTSTNMVLSVVNLGASTSPGAGDLQRSQTIRGSAIPEVGSGSKFYSIIADPYLKLGPGRYPFILVQGAFPGSSTSPSFSADCVIVGELSDN